MSNRPTGSRIVDTSMLDLIVCLTTLQKHVHNCCTTLPQWTRSDHRAVSLDLNLTSIKSKAKSSMNCSDINWRKICEEDEQCKLYNKYLLELTSQDKTCPMIISAQRSYAPARKPLLPSITIAKGGIQQAKASSHPLPRRKIDCATAYMIATVSAPTRSLT